MRQTAKDRAKVVSTFTLMVAIAIATGYFAALDGVPVMGAAFVGAGGAVALLMMCAECYRWWARLAWGAPFSVGDTVRIAKGANAGAEATVVFLGQGAEVEVEFEISGERHRKLLRWSEVRSIR